MINERLELKLKRYLITKGVVLFSKVKLENNIISLCLSKETSIISLQELYEEGFSCDLISKEDISLSIEVVKLRELVRGVI